MTMQALQEFLARHMVSTGALAAVAAALDARATGTALDPALSARIEELLEALGAGRVLDEVGAQEASTMRSMIRAMYLLDSKLLFPHTRDKLWTHVEPEILQSVGETSRIHAQAVTRAVVPACEGLERRLRSPGAAMLDVGVGVGLSAVAMAQMWPELRIVGIDPWQPALQLARENVDRAGLAHRIELREQGVETLDDRDAYDLVWFANPFIPEACVRPGLSRTLQALRPGGCILAGANNDAAPAPMAALSRLRMLQWSGAVTSPEDVQQLLRDAGFTEVRALPSDQGALAVHVVGRRESRDFA